MTLAKFSTEHCYISWSADVSRLSLMELALGEQGMAWVKRKSCFTCLSHSKHGLRRAEIADFSMWKELGWSLTC